MSSQEGPKSERSRQVVAIDPARRRRRDRLARVRDALERSADGVEPQIDGLLDAVPRLLREARERRESAARRDTLSASIPLARRAIPRLAVAAALLVALTAALLLGGGGTATTSSVDELVVAGNGVTDELIVQSILGREDQR